jgi:beta-aspartyl-peptidase (threonine type)
VASAVLAVHGGAGAVPSREEEPDYADAVRRGLAEALAAGHRALSGGGAAVDAVVAAVSVLEDREPFNAGVGSVLTREGRIEMGAAVMDGETGRAGAVTGVSRLRNPVRGALAAMQRSEHVLIAGAGAEALAEACGLELWDAERFVTPRRRAQLARARERGPDAPDGETGAGATVGAVARDARGHLAAATSTGGLAGQRAGRVSDSCLVGAGTWADDATCAVSATGHGESFILRAFAHEVDALLRHAGLGLEPACRRALAAVREAGGRGGCIAVDAGGRLALPFDTPAMPRGWIGADGAPHLVVAPGEGGGP